MSQRILIVDDDPEILDLLCGVLELSGFTIESAVDGVSGLQKALTSEFDLILLDVMMPKMNGFEVCKNIRKSSNEVPIILLTAKGTIQDKVEGFNCGADDYLVKPFDIQELLVRIRALFRRENKLTVPIQEVLSAGDIKIYPDALEAGIKGKFIKLTPTEFEILYCLMQHLNQAVALTTLLKEVWGYDSDDDVRMVRVHVGGLRQKIEPNPKLPQYLKTVTSVGYKLIPIAE